MKHARIHLNKLELIFVITFQQEIQIYSVLENFKIVCKTCLPSNW